MTMNLRKSIGAFFVISFVAVVLTTASPEIRNNTNVIVRIAYPPATVAWMVEKIVGNFFGN